MEEYIWLVRGTKRSDGGAALLASPALHGGYREYPDAEAILWDDESAFSGSMPDSNSVTKFNAATGLAWKEYAD